MHTRDFLLKIAKPLSKSRVDLIMQAMGTHLDSPDLLCGAVSALASVSYENAANAEALGKPCMKLVLDLMHTYEAHEHTCIQPISVSLLAYLVDESPERKAYAHELGAMQDIIRIMSKYSSDAALQRSACEFHHNMLLSGVSGDIDHNSLDVFTQNGGVEAMVRCMKAFEGEQRLQLFACSTFQCFVGKKDNAERLQHALDAGVHTAILRAMHVHRDYDRIQASGCQTLASILSCIKKTFSTHEDTRDPRHNASTGGPFANPARLALQREFMPAVLKAICVHAVSAQVQQGATGVLAVCWPDDSLKSEIAKHDALRALVRTLTMHTGNIDIVRTSCMSVSRAVRDHVVNQDRAGEVGVVDAVLKVVDKHKDNMQVRIYMHTYIYTCTDVIIAVLKVVDKHKDNMQVRIYIRVYMHTYIYTYIRAQA
jgi:hypothetical protein